MGIANWYRRMPGYFAVPVVLVLAALAGLTVALVGAIAADSLLDEIHGVGDLGDSFLAFLYVGPEIAVFTFVSCFSVFMNWHRAATWRTPTFAFFVGTALLWAWAREFGGIGIAPFAPGVVAWLLGCWFLRPKSNSSPHAFQT